MREPLDGEAIDDDDDEREVVTAITGDGVRKRRIEPQCPICTGGHGLPCGWHPLS